MTPDIAATANAVVSLAYFAITCAIIVPLWRVGQVGTNRLGTATAAIFFSCAGGHAFHAVGALNSSAMHPVSWYAAAWDVGTAGIAVYYWSLRRVYGSLMEGATLFEDLEQRARLAELEHRDAVTSARASAERERDAHETMLKAVIAHSQSVVYVKDLEGRYLLANSEFERTFGVDEADVLGRTDECLDADLAPVWRANDLRAQQEHFVVEEWADGPDGRHFYESAKFPLFDPDGTVYATCGMSLDVTGRRRADAEMARARDVALAATAAKSAFLATMSHEIRTPMNAVIGLTGLLIETELDEQQRDYVETVRSSGDALLVVINDILDFSKIEAGELHLESEPFDLRACAEGSLDLVAQAASDKGLDLVLQLGAECPQRVVGDASRLRQVLVNLLSNAVKFTDRGDVLLDIRAEERGPDVLLSCAVRDTGIGIPVDRMDRLFQSFSQVDASTTRVYGGTGLGLAISRRLVEAMGGRLGAESVVGEGSVFTATVLVPVAPAAPVPPPPASLAGRRVLVVDDNPANREVLGLQLSGWGMLSTAADGPERAMALLDRGERFDVAVLDMHMPGMNGDELARAMRRHAGGRDLPLVMLVSYGDRPSADAGVTYAAYVQKPARLSALRTALGTAIGGSDATPAPAGTPLPVPRGPRLRVLLAEDNLVNQKVACLMLGVLGHDVHTVNNGREAVAAVRERAYDIVLMDVHMPVMDGLEATRAIRAGLPPERQPRIVALTASVLLEDRQACAAAGMDDHLAKPVRQQQLAALLDQLVPAGRGPRVPAAFDTTAVDELVAPLGQQGAALRVDLLTSYVGEGDERMAEMVAGLRTGDLAAVRRVAHHLRSSSRVLGLVELSDLLERVEQLAVDGADVGPLVHEAAAQYRAAADGIAVVLGAAEVTVPV